MYRSLAEVRNDLLSGSISIEGLTSHYIQQIRNASHLNAFLEVFEESAMELARRADDRRRAGKPGRLSGMVIGLKDNICYKDHKVSAASRILEGFTSRYSATVVERLIAEDAVIIGRLNCDEFAMGSSNENSAYGSVQNPLDNRMVPGGSSGGSAAAVAAGLCLAALGTDTGGSIRQPASFCGVVGLKPTYGRVSRWGCIAYASSFDQIGPIANTVEDCAAILEVIAGADDFDATVSRKPVPDYYSSLNFSGKKRIAYLKDCLESEGLDPEIRAALMAQFEKLRADGHSVEPVDFPYLDYVIPAYYVLTTAEASSNLSRYDGIHYGYRSPRATDLETTYKYSRSEGFGKEVKRRIMLGTFVLSAGYYDAYYSRAQKVRRMIRDKTLDILRDYDFILSAATPGTAFPFGAHASDPVKMYLEDIYTVQANLAGIPAISVPAGKHTNGLPFGIQVMSAPFTETELLSFSATLQDPSLISTV
jgi:aspartyl-tRNA(Asn)/glutamyl-tRNA(Gln) amidotransferase subunit A